MYESPIDVFVTQLNVKRREFEEKQILEAVQGVGVNVDKHELEKALRYDREQYKKGYADGVKEFAERLKAVCRQARFSVTVTQDLTGIKKVLDNIPVDDESDIDNLVKEMVGEG